MIDSFPFEEWSDKIGAFWTFGPGSSTGTYVLTVLGIILMVGSLIGWVWLEDRKVTAQAAHLRAAGAFGPGTAPPQTPPLAGPSTESHDF